MKSSAMWSSRATLSSPDGASEGMAAGAVLHLADPFAIAVELFVPVRQGLGILDEHLHESRREHAGVARGAGTDHTAADHHDLSTLRDVSICHLLMRRGSRGHGEAVIGPRGSLCGRCSARRSGSRRSIVTESRRAIRRPSSFIGLGPS
jgi:hypothetical protein